MSIDKTLLEEIAFGQVMAAARVNRDTLLSLARYCSAALGVCNLDQREFLGVQLDHLHTSAVGTVVYIDAVIQTLEAMDNEPTTKA